MENTFNFDENIQYALEHIGSVLLDHTNLMESFKKKTYEEVFAKYKEECRPTFEAIEHACAVKEEERDSILNQCIERALNDFDASMSSMNKGKKNSYIENCKMVLALYTIPMILDLKMDISEEYADRLIEQWTQKYPKHVFKKGTYESLVEGFEKKGFCYITTAVCEMFDKPDDCYELMMFRGFRDEYLMKDEDGRRLVERYYELAPRILKAIDLKPSRDEIYHDIWENHLKECLSDIEHGQPEKCKNDYESMVLKLENQYIS